MWLNRKKISIVAARCRRKGHDCWDVLFAMQHHKTKNKFNQSAVWNETPCTSIRKDCVRRHSLSDQHREAVEKEVYRESSERNGGIQQAFQSQIELNMSAVKVAMQYQGSAHTGREWSGPTTTMYRATTTNLSPTSSCCLRYSSSLFPCLASFDRLHVQKCTDTEPAFVRIL